MLAAAQRAAARGWHVFPTVPDGKRPATRDGLKAATRDPQAVHELWTRHPEGNVAVHCGRSGLLVLDLDSSKDTTRRHGAVELAEHPACAGGQLGQAEAQTFVVLTPSGGLHLYFTDPGSADRPPTAGRIAPGVDTRSGESYVVLHGTVSGIAYEYQRTANRIIPAPTWLLALLTAPQSPTMPHNNPPRNLVGTLTPQKLAGLERTLRGATEGNRHAITHWVLRRLHEHGVPEQRAVEEVNAIMQPKGYTPRETISTARSIWRPT